MGTTPVYGLPYPDGSAKVIEGDDAMQALALAVEGMHAGEAVVIAEATAGVALGAGVTSNAQFPGTQLDMTGFSYSNPTGIFTRSGSPRLFMVSAQVEISVTGVGSVSSTLTLTAGGSARATSYDALNTAPTTFARQVMHSVCVPVFLTNGTTFTVGTQCSQAYTIGRTRMTAYPIGPR